jgi:hypothetical protein
MIILVCVLIFLFICSMGTIEFSHYVWEKKREEEQAELSSDEEDLHL